MKKYNKLPPDIYGKKLAIFNIILMFTAICFFMFFFLLMPKNEISEDENRKLAEFPILSVENVFNSKIANGISAYVSDHFPIRDEFLSFSNSLKEMRGIRFNDVTIHGAPVNNQNSTENSSDSMNNSSLPNNSSDITNDNTSSESSEESSNITEESSTQISENSSLVGESSSEISETAQGEQQGSTFIYKDRAMGMFGCNLYNGEVYAQVLNEYNNILGDDVKIYNMIVPTSIDFYIPSKYKSVTQPQKPCIDHIYSKLNDKISAIDAYSNIEKHKDEYIYFRSDHHWTGLGAYYAYEEFCKSADLTPLTIEDFETRRLDNFLGTLYNSTKDSKLKDNPDYVDYYMISTPHQTYRYVKDAPYYAIPSSIHGEYAVSPNSYSVFLHGDFPLTQIDTNIKNGRKIAVVKESYGNAFAPFLANHYEQVFIVDERYFQLGFIDFIKEKGINEIVFVNNSMAAFTPYHINNISGLKYQQFVPPAPPETEETEESSSSSDSSDESTSKDNSESDEKSTSDTSSSKSDDE